MNKFFKRVVSFLFLALVASFSYASNWSVETMLGRAQMVSGDTNGEYDYYIRRGVHQFNGGRTEECTIIFVDIDPTDTIGDECLYLYYGDNGSFELIWGNKPTDGGYTELLINSVPNGCPSHIHASVPRSNGIDNPDANRTYAVIVNGGKNPFENSVNYWNDCSYIYE